MECENEVYSECKMLKEKKEREEYLEKLKKWLDEARLWRYNIYSGFQWNFDENFRENSSQTSNTFFSNANQDNLQYALQQRLLFLANRNYQNTLFQTGQAPQRHQIPQTYEFIIPPLWKRAVAELLDFLLLLLVKVALTFILLESFDVIDMGFYGLELFQKNLENSEGSVPMAVELLTLELLHRVIVCVYEAYFLKGRLCATPGKRYMGLMVITAETITSVPTRPTETVSVTRAKPLGWRQSFTRATLKNLFVGLFLPLCIAFYIFPHNRTSYDVMSKSLVVEYHQEFMVYHSNM
ncbi:unnamed protein product [Psylliodes chrysocephalus]|uniref:RDD domain-containing protein n=1 Tax=Psylliodes chrysocephalus TaxID=3402493 RepID=A0A9P0CQZ5_9CUCU|nr:unnamed protein product [Psylliodes chrysocephala]